MSITVTYNDKALSTPQKKILAVPTQALADAIVTEWEANKKFSPTQMPLTALAYTAIDRIERQEDAVIEALMVYVDTDTLSYRSSNSSALSEKQQEKWDPIVGWASCTFGGIWQVTTGIMPLEQPQAIHEHIQNYLKNLSAMQLSACCVLASLYSSLLLALAVVEGKIQASEAFDLSRLEEDAQAEQWGSDQAATERRQRMQAEILSAGRFLRLLELVKTA